MRKTRNVARCLGLGLVTSDVLNTHEHRQNTGCFCSKRKLRNVPFESDLTPFSSHQGLRERGETVTSQMTDIGSQCGAIAPKGAQLLRFKFHHCASNYQSLHVNEKSSLEKTTCKNKT